MVIQGTDRCSTGTSTTMRKVSKRRSEFIFFSFFFFFFGILREFKIVRLRFCDGGCINIRAGNLKRYSWSFSIVWWLLKKELHDRSRSTIKLIFSNWIWIVEKLILLNQFREEKVRGFIIFHKFDRWMIN